MCWLYSLISNKNPCGSRTNSVVFRGINEPNWVRIVLQCILCDSGKILVTGKAKACIVHSDSEDCRWSCEIPLRMRAIPDRFGGVITTRRYIDSCLRLPSPYQRVQSHHVVAKKPEKNFKGLIFKNIYYDIPIIALSDSWWCRYRRMCNKQWRL